MVADGIESVTPGDALFMLQPGGAEADVGAGALLQQLLARPYRARVLLAPQLTGGAESRESAGRAMDGWRRLAAQGVCGDSNECMRFPLVAGTASLLAVRRRPL